MRISVTQRANILKQVEPFALNDAAQNMLFETLANRHKMQPKVAHSILKLEQAFFNAKETLPQAFKLSQILEQLQGRYFSLMDESLITGALYHTSFHANEMALDLYTLVRDGLLAANADISSAKADFYAYLAASMGAAHDIIQNLAAPANELASEEIYLMVLKNALKPLLKSSHFNMQQKLALVDFMRYALPFIARECLTLGTILNFGAAIDAPKHDLASIVDQVCKDHFPHLRLSHPMILLMQKSLSICDIRRSELQFVLKKHSLFKQIPATLYPQLATLLQLSNVISPTDSIEDILRHANDLTLIRKMQGMAQLEKIEAFLIRLGQNYRIQAENTVKFGLKEKAPLSPEVEQAYARVKLIQKLQPLVGDELQTALLERTEAASVVGFLAQLSGEIDFAKGLAASRSDILSSLEHATKFKSYLESMLSQHTWQLHAENLASLQSKIPSITIKQLRQLQLIIPVIAAKQPGAFFTEKQLTQLHQRQLELAHLQRRPSGTIPARDEAETDKTFKSYFEQHLSSLSNKSIDARRSSLNSRIHQLSRPKLDDMPASQQSVAPTKVAI